MPPRVSIPHATDLVVKVQSGERLSPSLAAREAYYQMKMARLMPGVVPKVIASWYSPPVKAHFTVMDWVNGKPLYNIISKGKGISAEMFVQIERAIVGMWLAGIAHMDLNVSNILVGSDGTPRIIDFGSARMLPKTLVPASYRAALQGEYQDKLLRWLSRDKAMNRLNRAALDPYILRLLYYNVADKSTIPTARALYLMPTNTGKSGPRNQRAAKRKRNINTSGPRNQKAARRK